MATRTPALAASGVILVVTLALLVMADLTDPFDHAIIGAVREPALFDILSMLRPVTELGSTGAITAVAVVTLAVGALIGPWRHGALGAATIGAASVGLGIAKRTVARERPDLLDPLIVEHGFSFPSGHATLSMTAYGVLAVIVARSRLPAALRIGLIGLTGVLVFLIGLSRVWIGVHYPTDVLAGWTTGAVVVLLFAAVTRRVSTEGAEVALDAASRSPRAPDTQA